MVQSVQLLRVLTKRIGRNAVYEELSAACAVRTFVYACWLLGDFSEQREDGAPFHFFII